MKLKKIEADLNTAIDLLAVLEGDDVTEAKFRYVIGVANPILERADVELILYNEGEAFGGKIGSVVGGAAKLGAKGVKMLVLAIPKIYLAVHRNLDKMIGAIGKINHSLQGRADWIAKMAKVEQKVSSAAKNAVDKSVSNYPKIGDLEAFLGNKDTGITFKIKLLNSASEIVNGDIADGVDMTKVLKHTDQIMKDSLYDMDLLLKAMREVAKQRSQLDKEVARAIRRIKGGRDLRKSNPVVKKMITDAFAQADEMLPKAVNILAKVKYASYESEKGGGFKLKLPNDEYRSHQIAWVDGTVGNLAKRTTSTKLSKHKVMTETKTFIKKGEKMPWGRNVKKYEHAADFVSLINQYKAMTITFVKIARDISVAGKNLYKNGVKIDKSLNNLGTKAAEECVKAWKTLKND